MPADGRGRDQPGHRPVLGRADDELDALGDRRPRRPGAAAAAWLEHDGAADARPARWTRRSTSCTCATSRSATRPCRPAHRGTYLAFTDADSDGHAAPADARRRPASTRCTCCRRSTSPSIQEDRADAGRRRPATSRRSPPDSDRAAGVRRRRCADTDGFNWGYDPWHYTTPEGSYATDPEGARPHARVPHDGRRAATSRACRSCWTSVYNHTTACGPGPEVGARPDRARLLPAADRDRRRRDLDLLRRTPPPSTAMMEKLMVDSVRHVGARVQGRRLPVRPDGPPLARPTCSPCARRSTSSRSRSDGVDGKRDLPVRRGLELRRGRQQRPVRRRPRQGQLGGTGIGTFTDRLRDAVRGGGPFDADPRIQGFGTGLYTDPNGAPVNGTADEQRPRLLLHARPDQARPGRQPARLRVRRPHRRDGHRAPTSTTTVSRPATPTTRRRSITYVDAHDNETLFDVAARTSCRTDTSMADRVRMNTVSLATTALSQAPSFWHAGTDLLRIEVARPQLATTRATGSTASTGRPRSRRCGSGLPPRGRQRGEVGVHAAAARRPGARSRRRPISTTRRPRPPTCCASASRRRCSGSARADLIQDRVAFPISGPDQTPGVITMTLDDQAGKDLDRRWEGIVVVFNATPDTQTQTVPSLAGEAYALHPVQAGGADAVVKTATYNAGDRRLHRPRPNRRRVHHHLNPRNCLLHTARGFVWGRQFVGPSGRQRRWSSSRPSPTWPSP